MGSRRRPGRAGGAPDGHPTHRDLQQVVIDSEERLRACWAEHRDADDLMVLVDVRREDSRRYVTQRCGRAAVAEALESARRAGGWPMLAYLEERRFLDRLAADGGFAGREAAREFRSFAPLAPLGVVPVLVVTLGGLWATQWAAPGSNAMVVRSGGETPVEAN